MAPAATAVAEVIESRKKCIAEGWGSGTGGWCAHRVVTPLTGVRRTYYAFPIFP